MFTDEEKKSLVTALMLRKAGLERSRAKATNPKFGPIYDEELRLLAALVMKVQALEVKNEREVPRR